MLTSQDPEVEALHEFHILHKEWDELTQICSFLAPLESMMHLMSEEGYPMFSLIIPKFNQLYNYFDAVIDKDDTVQKIASDAVIEAAKKGCEVLNEYCCHNALHGFGSAFQDRVFQEEWLSCS